MVPLRVTALFVVFLAGCAALGRGPVPAAPGSRSSTTRVEGPPSEGDVLEGRASYVAASFAGRRTASGTTFDPEKLTAAHRTLPFGTRIRVTNLTNGRKATLTVVDRGPFRKNRILDVSPRAARELGFEASGLTRVRIRILSEPDPDEAEADPR